METSLEKLQHASDAVLIRMFQRGSNRAFYVLVKRHQGNLKIYAYTRLHNSELEKDAIQNVWFEVIIRLQKRAYNEKGHFKEWIQSLLYWQTINLRKTETQYAVKIPDEKEAVTSIAEKLLFEKRLAQIKNCCSKLNKNIRKVVRLRVEEGMSFPDIARAMHTTTGNVTSWYSRAVRKLRKLNHK